MDSCHFWDDNHFHLLFDESAVDHLFRLGVNVMYHEDMYLVVQQV
jgi:hypothetical protein